MSHVREFSRHEDQGSADYISTYSMCMQTVFVQCGEPPRAGLLDAFGARAPLSFGQIGWSQGSAYHAATGAAQGFLDEVEYRSMMARYGL